MVMLLVIEREPLTVMEVEIAMLMLIEEEVLEVMEMKMVMLMSTEEVSTVMKMVM